MNNQDQIEALKTLLKQQGRTEPQIKFFVAYTEDLVKGVIGKFGSHFSKLLEMAKENAASGEDAAAAVNFDFKAKMDVTNLEVSDLTLAIGYSKRITDKMAQQRNVNDALSSSDPELPLGGDEELDGDDDDGGPDDIDPDDQDTPTADELAGNTAESAPAEKV